VNDPLGGSTLFRKEATKKTSGLFLTLAKDGSLPLPRFFGATADGGPRRQWKISLVVPCLLCAFNQDAGTRVIWVVSVPMN